MSGRGSPPASPGEQGSAMLVVATILAALLAGGGVALYLQLEGTKSVSLTRSGLSSLYCAEAGVAKAQSFFTSQVSLWPDFIDGIDANDPAGYPVTGDIDGDGTADYEVRLADNDDEPSGANDTTVDLDGRVFMIARCLQKTGGNKRRAARLLQLSRTTLIDKLHRLNPSSAA